MADAATVSEMNPERRVVHLAFCGPDGLQGTL